uniref:NADH-ubiquinone oxidoreductase chain 4L n=1 Tax=Pediastrum angulosum TaxID=271408 RepID=A0A2Z4EL51_9CHLO|nr:NADH dehydrogenase subunit 4L [Pediastrum angulosum]
MLNFAIFLFVFVTLFVMGTVGTFLNRRNFVTILTGSVALDDLNGQLLALLVMTAALSETALGLALCVLHYRMRATLDVELVNLMKG